MLRNSGVAERLAASQEELRYIVDYLTGAKSKMCTEQNLSHISSES
jgi:hypothetical protein